MGGVGDVIFTTGAGTIVTVDVAERLGSSNETAATVTVGVVGTCDGARYLPLESIRPSMSLPPVILFTCQVTTLFVPPEIENKNWACVSTFTDAVAGEIVRVIFVTGSVHVEVEDEPLPVVVVHVMAVLGAAAL
jgi:hypothetical protein